MKKQSIFAFFLACILFLPTLPHAAALNNTESAPSPALQESAAAEAPAESPPETPPAALPPKRMQTEGPKGIRAEAALLIDVQRDQAEDTILFDQNGSARRYPASTTKIMTALLVLEAVDRGQLQLDTPIRCSESALSGIGWDASTQNIQAGELMSVENLLYCLLCASANEAGNILAEAVSGEIGRFVEQMNERASELGMENTHFSNTHGLHESNHYTTAYDLYLLTRSAMEHSVFQKIVSTADYTVPATNMAGERRFFNTNALLSTWLYSGYDYSPATGVKTGYTGEAGYCLVSSAWHEGRMLICVVLGAETEKDARGHVTDRRQFSESRTLLRWGFTNFKIQPLVGPGTLLSEVPVALGKNVSYVLAGPGDTIHALLPSSFRPEDVSLDVTLLREQVRAPVKQGQLLGSATVAYGGISYGSCDLVAVNSVELSVSKLISSSIAAFFGNLIVQLALIALAIFIVLRYIRTSRREPRRGNRKPPSNTTPYPGTEERNQKRGGRRRL